MALDIYVTRPELTLPDLSFMQPGIYEFYGQEFNGGERTWKRYTVGNSWVHGEFEVNSVLNDTVVKGRIDVLASDYAALQSRAQTVINALSQKRYEFHVDTDGTDWSWNVRRADVTPMWEAEFFFGWIAAYDLSIPRSPIPISGPV